MNWESTPVLMLTPFHHMQRGNTLTTLRLQTALRQRGFTVDLLSLEEKGWRDSLREYLINGKYSLVHGFNARYFGGVLTEFPELRNLPLILTTTGSDLNYDLKNSGRDLVLAAFAAAEKIIVFHDYFQKLIGDAYPEYCSKLSTIPQGVWLEESPPIKREMIGLAADNIVFALPSGLRPVKDIELAIDGLQRVYKDFPELRLLIIGPVIDRDYGQKIKQRVSELNWVFYLGEVLHSDMGNYLSLADVILNTSQAEGQPQGLLEGMSQNKPAILTAVPGNLDIIEEGRQGYYVRNQEELAVAARKMLSSAESRQRMGWEAGKLVKEKFSLAREIQSYAELYRQVLSP
ncbi:glycosyltransferase [Syntrophomonas wolfei]|uniref:Glycosyl transferase, group 1 n=1 Tax=Syntrophomonas wolfei subsp. wolfei (strain DSM 2245B / Goettingen) TaxID=335541 RepID=Q0AU71_SYNWW|nr:glycosyltransferase [Syntrophomonas wolfei]ABI69733.1 glycosyl transferase, group 1 [Syntrophomonas wolfei subsp. wolfei str. Goettingen G311]